MNAKTILMASTALLLSFGCNTTNRLIKKHKKVKTKLLNKGVVVPKDTLIVNNYDTLIRHYTYNDTLVKEITVIKEITLEPTVEVKTRWQTRIEYKERIKIVKAEVKKEKQKTKQSKRRSQWYLLFIGLGLGFVLNLYIKKLFV